MKKVKAFILSIMAIITLSTPILVVAPAMALFEGSKDQACKGANLNDAACSSTEAVETVNTTVKTVVNLLSFLVGIVSVIMIIVGGIRFVVSQGNAQAVTNARNTIFYAIIGLVIAAIAQVLVKFVIGRSTT